MEQDFGFQPHLQTIKEGGPLPVVVDAPRTFVFGAKMLSVWSKEQKDVWSKGA